MPHSQNGIDFNVVNLIPYGEFIRAMLTGRCGAAKKD